MPVDTVKSSVAKPDIPDLLARAGAIAELARGRAQQTETERRVSDNMIERMRQADLFRVMQPRAYGGFEYGFEVFAQIVAAIASGCGSTGWVYGLLASHQWLIACFSQAAQDEVWQAPTALAAGTYAPVARAVAVEGGYRLSGTGEVLQRLRQLPVAASRRHDPAAGRSRDARLFPAAQWPLHHRGQLANHGAGRHGQQEYRRPGRIRACPSHADVLRACRCHRSGHARQLQSALSAVLPRRAADHHRLAGARHGGRRPR